MIITIPLVIALNPPNLNENVMTQLFITSLH